MGVESLLLLGAGGMQIFAGIEQEKAGKAAKEQADEAAEEERLRAAKEASLAVEEQHDILVESKYEAGALKAIGGKAGVGGISFNRQLARVKATQRRKQFLLQKRTAESMRRSYFSAEQLESEGRQAGRAGKQASYMSYMQAGLSFASAFTPKTTTSGGRGTYGGGSQQTTWGHPYYR